MFFAKIIFYQLHENQPKHLQAIERKIKCNVLKKYIMQLCEWNGMYIIKCTMSKYSYTKKQTHYQPPFPKNMDN
jgi:hypothetical protein